MPERTRAMSDRQVAVEAFLRHQLLRGAIASTSLSHPELCECTTCRAARGDEQAFIEVLDMVNRHEERRQLTAIPTDRLEEGR